MEILNQYSQYLPHVIAAAALLVFLLFILFLLRRRKRQKTAPQKLTDALPKQHGIAYQIGKGIWLCIAAVFKCLLFLLKLIVPNMVLVERLLSLGGIALIAYPFIFPPMNYYFIGGGVFALVLAIVAHAYNDEMRRNSMEKNPY